MWWLGWRCHEHVDLRVNGAEGVFCLFVWGGRGGCKVVNGEYFSAVIWLCARKLV